MPSPRTIERNSALATLIAIVLVIAVLWAAKVVLIPLALAVLLTFLLAPLCDRLERWRMGRVLSVLMVTTSSFVIIAAIGWTVAGQVIDFAGQLPHYRNNIREKVESLRLPPGGPLRRATESIQEIGEEILSSQNGTPDAPSHPPASATPLPVEIVSERAQPLDVIITAVQPLLVPLSNAAIVIVFVIFMLLQRNDLRDRMIRLLGRGRLTVATQAIDDAARRVSRFLLMQLIVNATYGLAIGVGLYFIGLPNAILWGVLACLVRFIPYAGPWIGSLLPITVALAVFDQWVPVVETIALFVIVELISNNVMEPLLYGQRTGISPVAILASAVFWAWLWGPVGLVLATPLTVCVVVMGRYIPRLEFLAVLLSDEPGLTPAARVYQRLLAMDVDEAFDICESHLAEKPLLDLYEQVLLPALGLAERDRHQDQIEPEREEVVFQGFEYLVDELGERYKSAPPSEKPSNEGTKSTPKDVSVPSREPILHTRIMCIPARDLADRIAAQMMVQVLEGEGLQPTALPQNLTISEMLSRIEEYRPDALCISALPPQAMARTRSLCRRMTSRFPEVKTIVGFWTMNDVAAVQRRVGPCDPERLAGTFSEALDLLRD